MSNPELSIIVPAYNEAKRLPGTLTAIQRYVARADLNAEIVVVNDGSSDETAAVAHRYPSVQVLERPHGGKGAAIRAGITAVKGRYLLLADADNSVPIEQLGGFWPLRDRYDLIIGSRFLLSSRFETQRGLRLLVSKLGNLLFRALFGLKIADTQCGFKFARTAVAKDVIARMKMEGFIYDMEFLVLADRAGYTILELPVDWHDAPGSTVRAVHTSLRSVVDLISFWLRDRFWRFKD